MCSRLATAALLGSLLSCQNAELPFVDVSGLEVEYLFVLELGQTGTPRLVAGPFDPGAGALTLKTTAGELLLLGLGDGDLESITPLYDPARSGDLAIAERDPDPDCAGGELNGSSNHLAAAVPAEAKLFLVAATGGSPRPVDRAEVAGLSHLSLILPVDPEACAGERDALTEFAALPRDPLPIGIRDLAMVDRNRALVLGADRLLLAEEGMSSDEVAASMVVLAEPQALPRRSAYALAVGPDSGPGQRRRIVIGGRIDISELEIEGLIWETWLDGNELTDTTTIAVLPGRIDDIVLSPDDGRLVAASREGSVYVQSQAGAPFERLVLSTIGSKDPAHLELTGSSEQPFLLGGPEPGQILIGDPEGRRWEGQSDGLELRSYPGLAALGGLSGLEIFAIDDRGTILKRAPREEGYEPVTLRLPPRFEPCAAAATEGSARICGWTYLGRGGAERIVTWGPPGQEHLLLQLPGCTAVVEAPRDLRCGGYFPLPGGIRVANDAEQIRSIAVFEDRFVLGDESGRLLTLILE